MRRADIAVGAILATTGAVAPLAVACSSDGAPDRSGLATVAAVVDGDTIEVRIAGRDERVRLIGIDTPETLHPDRPVECHGPEASAFTATLLAPGTPIRIERDTVGRDHFGRLLGYVHLAAEDSPTGGNVFVNLEIVERGHATPMSIEPNVRHAAEFAAAARRAERADLGLWAACDQVASPG